MSDFALVALICTGGIVVCFLVFLAAVLTVVKRWSEDYD